MRKRIVITGLGAICPVGNDVETTWNNLLAGQSGAGPITLFDASDQKCTIAAEIKGFDPEERFGRKEARRMDRATQIAIESSLQALAHSGLVIGDDNRDRIGAVIGTGIGGSGTNEDQTRQLFDRGPDRSSPFHIPMILPDNAGGQLAINLGIRGPNFAVLTACASGTNAIGEAVEIIRRGQADVMFAGGTEAVVTPLIMAGMAAITALTGRNDDPTAASRPFDKDRDGFLMGEGAGMLILESLEHAQDRGAAILAEVTGYGSTNDAYHISAPAENGAGAARCMQMALDHASLTPEDIHYINAHGTSTELNDKNETAAIKTVFGETAYNIPVSSTKSMTGHLIGGTGALEAVISTKALLDNKVPPTINYTTPDPECDLDYVPNAMRQLNVENVMTNSFGFGGHNATLILSQVSEVAS